MSAYGPQQGYPPWAGAGGPPPVPPIQHPPPPPAPAMPLSVGPAAPTKQVPAASVRRIKTAHGVAITLNVLAVVVALATVVMPLYLAFQAGGAAPVESESPWIDPITGMPTDLGTTSGGWTDSLPMMLIFGYLMGGMVTAAALSGLGYLLHMAAITAENTSTRTFT